MMWTRFVSSYSEPDTTNDEYDFVFMECNEPSARILILELFPETHTKYIAISSDSDISPELENVQHYTHFYSGFEIRVISMDELKSKGLVS